jgi:cytosine/adenosine deaminase-related metal-dependent hydrolase
VAGTGASVVHCPKCHTYFGHAPFPLRALQQKGVNICLGTDSLASNNQLDLRSEMREAQQLHGLDDREVLEMVTLNAARALGQEGRLGRISPGSVADLVAFRHEAGGTETEPYRRVVQSRQEPVLLLVNGHRVEVPSVTG